MNIDSILSSFSPEVRESTSMRGLVVLVRTLLEQLQATKEQLTKSQEKIKALEDELSRLRKTPKRPKFRPNGMQPRNRDGSSQGPSNPTIPTANALFAQKEISEIKIKVPNPPEGSRFKGYQTFSVQDIGLVKTLHINLRFGKRLTAISFGPIFLRNWKASISDPLYELLQQTCTRRA